MNENIITLFRKSVSKITAIAILGSAMIFSTAASAEAAADSSIPVDVLKSQAAESALGEADPAFRMIFNNWAGQGKQEAVKLTIPSLTALSDGRNGLVAMAIISKSTMATASRPVMAICPGSTSIPILASRAAT